MKVNLNNSQLCQLVWYPKWETRKPVQSLWGSINWGSMLWETQAMNNRHWSLAKDKRLNTSITCSRDLNRRVTGFSTSGKQGAITVRWTERLITGCHSIAIKIERPVKEKKNGSFKYFDIFLEMLSNIHQWGLHQLTVIENLTKIYTLN